MPEVNVELTDAMLESEDDVAANNDVDVSSLM